MLEYTKRTTSFPRYLICTSLLCLGLSEDRNRVTDNLESIARTVSCFHGTFVEVVCVFSSLKGFVPPQVNHLAKAAPAAPESEEETNENQVPFGSDEIRRS